MKKRGILLYQLVLVLLITLIVFGIGVTTGNNVMKNVRTDNLRSQCNIIDRSLEAYAKSHRGVTTTSVTYNSEGKVSYTQNRQYPENLTELGEIQDKGYFSTSIDLTKFTYSMAQVSDGTMVYKLEVHLPDGTVYTSPGSNK